MRAGLFIDRPKFALVISLVLALVGGLCLSRLPISDYPELAPPIVSVTTSYPGADPQVVADTVATPIEDQINGVDNIYFFDSRCNDSGSYELYVTFNPGTDTDINLVNVQNAVKRAEPKLPGEVVQLGLTVTKCASDYVLRFAFTTDGREMGLLQLGNFVTKEIKDALQRVPGVCQVSCSDREFAMRVWLDPLKMDALGISVFDVKNAIAGQNIQPAAGFVGTSYSSKFLSYKINVRGRLVTEEEFESIVVRSDPATGARVLLGDIARCELGTKSYASEPMVGTESAFYANAYVDPRANSVEVADLCKREIEAWMKRAPAGVSCRIVRDNSEFTREILGGVVRSLLVGLVLAAVALFVLFGTWRTALAAVLALPLPLLGAAIFLVAAGYTLDVFSAFGLVLATGAIVNNAVVVVDAARRALRQTADPVRAAKAALRESSGVVAATTFIAVACYAPLYFHGGMVGMMYVRFAATLSAAVLFSAFFSLVLLPPLLARLAKPDMKPALPFRPVDRLLDALQGLYLKAAAPLARHPWLSLLAFAVVVALAAAPAPYLARTFLPEEDRGVIKIEAELSEGSSLERTRAVVARANELIGSVPGVRIVGSAVGSSNVGKIGECHGEIVVLLEHWRDRRTDGTSLHAVAEEIEKRLKTISIANFTLMFPTSITGMGGMGGVVVYLCAVGYRSPAEQAADAEAYAEKLRKRPEVKSVTTMFSAATPMLHFDVDRDKAQALGVPASTIFSTMQNQLASFYVNDFNLAGGAHQVVVQNDYASRTSVENALDIRFPGRDGAMVPLSSVGSFKYTLGPRVIPRYNKLSSAGVVVVPAEGVSSLEVIDMIERDPPDPAKYVLNWSTMNREERASQGKIGWLVGLAILFSYLVLVAKYESWLLPLPVLATSAAAVAGAFLGLRICGEPLSIYAQLGLLLLLEFPMRNAAVVVEHARQARAKGADGAAAARAGAETGFRPAVLSGLAYLLALAVLFFASGVGAASQRALAVTVFSGVVAALTAGLLFTPALYALVAGHHDGEKQ